MKIQTKAVLEELKVNNQRIPMDEDQVIDLEFSAIDAGGGFKDPMLDFSIALEESVGHQMEDGQRLNGILVDPNNDDNQVEVSVEGGITVANGQINGRIKEDQLSREVIGFVLNLLR